MSKGQHYESRISYNDKNKLYCLILYRNPEDIIHLGCCDEPEVLQVVRHECINLRRQLNQMFLQGRIDTYEEVVDRTEDYAQEMIFQYYKLKEWGPDEE